MHFIPSRYIVRKLTPKPSKPASQEGTYLDARPHIIADLVVSQHEVHLLDKFEYLLQADEVGIRAEGAWLLNASSLDGLCCRGTAN